MNVPTMYVTPDVANELATGLAGGEVTMTVTGKSALTSVGTCMFFSRPHPAQARRAHADLETTQTSR
jgi:hypothetical protein